MNKLISILVLFLIGCQSVESNRVSSYKYFDVKGFTNTLIRLQATQKSDVEKISFANEVIEKVEIADTDTLFWKTVLTPLLNADINKPSLVDAYRIDENLTDRSSNLTRTVYTSKPNTNSMVKKLEVRYLNNHDDVRQIIAILKNNNLVYNSTHEIHLWVNKYNNKLLADSLKISGYNKTLFQDSLRFETTVIVRN